jgi:hypothetical protein
MRAQHVINVDWKIATFSGQSNGFVSFPVKRKIALLFIKANIHIKPRVIIPVRFCFKSKYLHADCLTMQEYSII